MVVVAAIAMLATLPGRTQGLGLITEPLLQELQISRVAYGDMNLWATLIGAVFCLPCGWLIDRFGCRVVLTGVVAALAVVTCAVSLVDQFSWLFALITLTRGFGQSMLSVVSITIVGRWFSRRLPLAMGVYSLLIGIGFAAAFVGVGSLVQSIGWRATWFYIGLALGGFAAFAWILVRDGAVVRAFPIGQEASESQPAPAAARTGATLPQALGSTAFWVFALASSMYGLISSGISLFNESLLNERGFDANAFYTSAALTALVGVMFNLLGGWLAVRHSMGRLLGSALFALTAALLAYAHLTTLIQVYAYAAVMGAAGGIVTVMFFSVWAKAFGQAHLGKIQGAAQLITVVSSALGPEVLARCQAMSGSYSTAFYILAPLVALLGVAAWVIQLPDGRRDWGARDRRDHELAVQGVNL